MNAAYTMQNGPLSAYAIFRSVFIILPMQIISRVLVGMRRALRHFTVFKCFALRSFGLLLFLFSLSIVFG